MLSYWFVTQRGSDYKCYQPVDTHDLSRQSSISNVRDWMANQQRSFNSKVDIQSVLIEAHAKDFLYPTPLWWSDTSVGNNTGQGLLDVEVENQFHTIFFWHDFLNFITLSRAIPFESEDSNTELRRMIKTEDLFSHFKRKIFTLGNERNIHPYFVDEYSCSDHVFYRKDKDVPSCIIRSESSPWSPWRLPVVLPKQSIFLTRPSLDIDIAASIIRVYHYASTMRRLDFDVNYVPRQEWCNMITDENTNRAYNHALHEWVSYRPDAFELLRERRLLTPAYDVGLSKQVIKL